MAFLGLLGLATVWQPAPPLPKGAAGFGHAALHDKLVVFGGTAWEGGTKLTLDTAWRLDDSWHALPPLPRRFAYGAFWSTDGNVMGCAGDDGISTRRDAFSLDGTEQPPALPRPVAYAGCASDGTRVYVLGGTEDIRDVKRAQAGFFVLEAGRWTQLPDYPEGPVIHAALAVVGNTVLVFPGGTVRGTINNSTHAWRFMRGSGRWEQIADYPFAVRGLGACGLNDRVVLLAGGDTGSGNTDRCFCYDSTSNRYFEAPHLPVAAMMVGLERIGPSVYAIGGEDRAQHRSAAVNRALVEDLLPRQ